VVEHGEEEEEEEVREFSLIIVTVRASCRQQALDVGALC